MRTRVSSGTLTPIMKNLPLLIGSLALTLALVIGVSMVFTKKTNEPVVPVDQQLLVSDTPHVTGSASASATLVEFSDFQCPACRSVQPLVTQIKAQYGEKLRFVYRHFPLRSIHKNAAMAARASEAAAKQNKFFAYHDKLFEVQPEWEGDADPTLRFIAYAKELGLNEEQFKKDIADSALDARVLKDEADATTIGVSATPTFYLNGIKTDVTELPARIDALLAGQ